MPARPQSQPAADHQPGRKYFTLAEANRALPYVSRIAEDIRKAYRHAVDLQERLESTTPEGHARDDAHADYERTINELNRYVDELHEVGVELKDYDQCLIDFPALHEDREISLCWKRGESEIRAWHEVDAGFPGRKDVRLLDATPTPPTAADEK